MKKDIVQVIENILYFGLKVLKLIIKIGKVKVFFTVNSKVLCMYLYDVKNLKKKLL